MPNWCFTSIDVRASETSIDAIYSEMEKALSENPYGADFGNGWLGNLLGHIGLLDKNGKNPDVRHRGSVGWFERTSPGTISLSTESAWGPHITCIQKFVEHFAPDAEVTYTAEECGCGLYWTNDPKMAGKARIDCWDVEDVPEELLLFESCDDVELDVVEAELRKVLGEPDLMLDHLVTKYNAMLSGINPDAGWCVNPFEFVEIGEDT